MKSRKREYRVIEGSERRLYTVEEMNKMSDKNQDIVFCSIPGTDKGWLVSHSAGH